MAKRVGYIDQPPSTTRSDSRPNQTKTAEYSAAERSAASGKAARRAVPQDPYSRFSRPKSVDPIGLLREPCLRLRGSSDDS